jgi:hypothetical protein
MAMTTLEMDTLTLACGVCKTILTDLQPRLAALQQQYDSGGGVKETLTQEDLDAAPTLSGLTKAQADDGLYALTAVLLPAIEASYPALSQLAARYRGFAPPPPTILP